MDEEIGDIMPSEDKKLKIKKPFPEEKPKFKVESPGLDWKKIIRIATIAIIGIVFVSIIYMLFSGSKNCGEDIECFIDRANDCKSAKMTGLIGDGTVVNYETRGCVLTKYISYYSDSEPDEVVEFFSDKKMTCKHEKGDFDFDLASGLSLGLDGCEGELKDAIIELRLAQLALENP